jgi:glycosyltransferase involved in cell wall biosynthesis
VRVALVHDWLTGMRGGERCLEVFCELFPDADLFTLLYLPGRLSPTIERRRIFTSLLQHLPGVASRYRSFLPLFPWAVERFDLSGYDLILSASHCVAKGVRIPPGVLHVCYCFTPMRYIWDSYDDYFGERAGWVPRHLMPLVAPALRRWDVATSRRVHHFVAISSHVAQRVARCYGRQAEVVYPPVDLFRFNLSEETGDYYLVVSALAPYKRVDLAVEAANRLRRRLLIVGSGQEERRLRAMAGPTVEFLGWREDGEVAELYARCRALLFPGVEDFGITPLEAMATGKPVIAFGQGGARETVVPLDQGFESPTGLFFSEQTPDALVGAIRQFEADTHRFDPKTLRAHASAFDRPLFKERISASIARYWREFSLSGRGSHREGGTSTC